MVTEFDTETETGNQVYDEDGIHFYWVAAKYFIKHPHATHQLDQD